MEKELDKFTTLGEDEYEQIGDDEYCIYCGNKVVTKNHFTHAHGDSCDRLCSCLESKEAAIINGEIINRQRRLSKLKSTSTGKLSWMRYVQAANHLASDHCQPIPFPLGNETPQPE